MMLVTDKIALVTGASRGIGAAVADVLANAGAIVIGTATSKEQSQKIHDRLSPFKGAGKCLNVDNNESVLETVESIQKEFGPITILVNNAGITKDNLLMRMTEKEWDDVLNINLKSIYRTSKAVLRGMMKAKEGRIINITSVIGRMGNSGQTNYAASKSGMMGFTKSLAREVGSRNITVNCIAPGFIQTDMTDNLSQETVADILSEIPLGVLGEAKDIANTVLFLASEGAKYITGQTIHVNGGLLME
ncbi:MAG: 3-oxoacyl-ACP reductase FabG [Neisseriaceae bacterium]|nr:MAG: 3-oxoacyl-ACP reductase FabG [Neisseriaceae bacterium]